MALTDGSLEAARAGEADKGFAVVAEEVRSLASRSAEAARETTVLLGETVGSIDEGTRAAQETSESMLAVVTHADEMSGLIDSIAENTSRQAEGAAEIAYGIEQISSVVDSNADNAQRSAAEMILEAKRDTRSAKLYFSVQDMFRLPYANQSFNVVIVSNALHIVPQPEKALQEIKRVLKDDGVLIAPTFTHAGNSFSGKVRAFFMKRVGFPLHSKWTSAEYLRFLRQNGWAVRKSAVLKASFPLTYAECVKSEV